jgi:hypothetical protein
MGLSSDFGTKQLQIGGIVWILVVGILVYYLFFSPSTSAAKVEQP